MYQSIRMVPNDRFGMQVHSVETVSGNYGEQYLVKGLRDDGASIQFYAPIEKWEDQAAKAGAPPQFAGCAITIHRKPQARDPQKAYWNVYLESATGQLPATTPQRSNVPTPRAVAAPSPAAPRPAASAPVAQSFARRRQVMAATYRECVADAFAALSLHEQAFTFTGADLIAAAATLYIQRAKENVWTEIAETAPAPAAPAPRPTAPTQYTGASQPPRAAAPQHLPPGLDEDVPPPDFNFDDELVPF